MSLPSRGAWIEIVTAAACLPAGRSLPSRGAWIAMGLVGVLRVKHAASSKPVLIAVAVHLMAEPCGFEHLCLFPRPLRLRLLRFLNIGTEAVGLPQEGVCVQLHLVRQCLAKRLIGVGRHMQLSRQHEAERLELKSKLAALRKKLSESGQQQKQRENFVLAMRRFMQMNSPAAPLLRELMDHMDVLETEGTGKNCTQRIVRYCRFVGYVESPQHRNALMIRRIPAKASPLNPSQSRSRHHQKEQETACYAHQTVARQKNRVFIRSNPL